MRSTSRPLHSAVLLYPAAVLGDSGVDAWFVPASAAVAPAHHAGQEDPPTGAGDGQRPAGVALRESQRRVRVTEQKIHTGSVKVLERTLALRLKTPQSNFLTVVNESLLLLQ